MGMMEYIKKQVFIDARESGIEIGLQNGLKKGLKEGMEKGMEKGNSLKNIEFTKNLIQNTDFNNKKIASLVGVSVAFVKKIRAGLN